jgi:hypothetical protein
VSGSDGLNNQLLVTCGRATAPPQGGLRDHVGPVIVHEISASVEKAKERKAGLRGKTQGTRRVIRSTER